MPPASPSPSPAPKRSPNRATSRVQLPMPVLTGRMSLEETLARRRALRSFAAAPLSLADCAQLLWAAQGVTHPEGYRTTPSAGALYPLEVYLVAGAVTELPAGVYHYRPHAHELRCVLAGDLRAALAASTLGQAAIAAAPAVIVPAGVFDRTLVKYGDRGIPYVQMEAGAAAQNVALQAVSRGLGSVYIGAYDDEAVKAVLRLPADHEPLCLLPVGYPALF